MSHQPHIVIYLIARDAAKALDFYVNGLGAEEVSCWIDPENVIYLGNGVYGVEAASRDLFGKSVGKVSLAEAATLAGLPKAPSSYTPRDHPDRALKRRNVVLGHATAPDLSRLFMRRPERALLLAGDHPGSVTHAYADMKLMAARSGLSTPDQFLGAIGSWIDQLQKSPGRLAQTLEQSSAGVWNNSTSGVNPNATTVSYYVKGAIVAFLLDARIRHASNGARSLDDVMRVAYRRYGGERGYTPAQFRATASEVARTNLDEWFRRAVASTEELDSSEALDWFGLALRDGTLAAHPDATAAQRDHLAALIAGTLR